MARVCRWLAFAWLVAVLLCLPRAARAEGGAHTVPVAVLSLDSEDAEENAESLTAALRSRIRASQGWSLVETAQSVGMLTAALRCPSKPIPADCEQRIADQLKIERYIYGFVTKGPQATQVTAEIHLYQRSKSDTIIRESYAENLKDQNDDTLRKIAQRVLDRLGSSAVGTIVVKMGTDNGEVIVDGDKRLPLQNGSARLELAPGSHSVEVLVGGQTQKRNTLVTVGKETVVDLSLAPSGTFEEPASSSKPFPTRKVVGGGMMALGVASAVVGVLEFVAWSNRKDDGEQLQRESLTNPAADRLPPGQSADDACGSALQDTSPICRANHDAKVDSALGWVFTGVGAALIGGGAYVFFTKGSEQPSDKPRASTPRLVPHVGRGGGSLVLEGRF